MAKPIARSTRPTAIAFTMTESPFPLKSGHLHISGNRLNFFYEILDPL
ncbi:hypothetical protein [Brasilonema sp. UFV-L1]